MSERLFDLSGNVAVVIGGTGVLGGALAEALAASGAAVAIAGRNKERGNARCVAIRSCGGTAEYFLADASSRQSLTTLKRNVASRLGPATILVNAAGGNDPSATVTQENPFEGISLQSWSSCFDLNVSGSVLLPCQEFGPVMCAAGKGSIINIASVAGHIPLSRVVAYSAAKAAIVGMTLTIARDLSREGIRVNTIQPGIFNTPAMSRATPQMLEALGSMVPFPPRLGLPEEFASMALELIRNGYVNGETIRLDGAIRMQPR